MIGSPAGRITKSPDARQLMVGKLTLAFEDQLLRDAFHRVAISWKLEKGLRSAASAPESLSEFSWPRLISMGCEAKKSVRSARAFNSERSHRIQPAVSAADWRTRRRTVIPTRYCSNSVAGFPHISNRPCRPKRPNPAHFQNRPAESRWSRTTASAGRSCGPDRCRGWPAARWLSWARSLSVHATLKGPTEDPSR
jgi:hypothetical protein